MNPFTFLDTRSILEWIGKYLDDKVSVFKIQPEGGEWDKVGIDARPTYLKRWYLFRLTEPEKYPQIANVIDFVKRVLGIELYLHKITHHDGDRHLHNHPWPFASVVLFGGYKEFNAEPGKDAGNPDNWYSVNYRAPTINFREADPPHRLQLFLDASGNPMETWTLVIRGRKVREWGFFTTEKGWIPHNEYLDWLYGQDRWKREPHYYDEEVKP